MRFWDIKKTDFSLLFFPKVFIRSRPVNTINVHYKYVLFMRWPQQICFQQWLHLLCRPYLNETMALSTPALHCNLHTICRLGTWSLSSLVWVKQMKRWRDRMWLTVKDIVDHTHISDTQIKHKCNTVSYFIRFVSLLYMMSTI